MYLFRSLCQAPVDKAKVSLLITPPMQGAAEELLELGAAGLQLTPGNVPTPNFWQWLQDYQVDSRTHHGFHYRALKCKVWKENAECLPKSHSVHPPRLTDSMVEVWRKKLAAGAYSHLLLETMYPGYCLGDGEEIARAMAMSLTSICNCARVVCHPRSGGDSRTTNRSENFTCRRITDRRIFTNP